MTQMTQIRNRFHVLICVICAICGSSSPVTSQTGNDTGDAEPPVAIWHFDGAAEPGVPKGAALDPGPRPPSYPAFGKNNTSYAFTSSKPALTIRETDLPKANLRFANGDSITLEAWVKVQELKDGNYAYLIGKGRTRAAGFPEKNQNYALRLFGSKGEACVSFLFASAPTKDKPADWHRWTSTKGFTSGGWHHVAVCYIFGKPASIRAYIDGEKVAGKWDMGGATERPPVNDADDLQLGTGNGGGAGNTFKGWMDDVTIWRTALPESTLTARYQFIPPPPVVKRTDVPRGQVLVQLCEDGLPNRNAWPENSPATETYREEAFGFFQVPHKYVDTGVRDQRANPFLLRAAAIVSLPAGKHRLLLRGRGATRLYVDDKLVLTTPFPPTDSSGHGQVAEQKNYLDLGPDFRFVPPGNRETWTTFETRGGEHLVVMESIVGGYIGNGKRRPELGETVVAISPQGSESWQLLSPASRTFPYTDEGWAAYEAERIAHYERVNADARAAMRKQHAAYWDRRRDAARKWLSETEEVKIPPLAAGFPERNPIDNFIADKIVRVRAQNSAKGTVEFFKHVQPILESKCLECHSGEKAKGGLRLDDPATAFKGGKSDGPAIVAGKPEASAIIARIRSADDSERMPPKGDRLTKEQIQTLETWIQEGARWPEFPAGNTTLTPITDDLAFLRRVTLDTVGVVPTLDEIRAFLTDPSPDRRNRVIDRLLADPRWADNWMGYWQDVLAENPNIINPTLNNTGPFRWWLYESLLDNKPMDLFVTELVRMRGSERYGGPAGFGVASQNDVPMAQKGAIVASAFLGVQMKCARCHDAPAHRSTQKDLFQLAATLATKPLVVPATSSVPLDKIHTAGGRQSLIAVTLRPGSTVEPAWPFAGFAPEHLGRDLAQYPDDPRDRLAALVTAPQNERFAHVIVNRVWQRLMGRGLVEPVDDWERAKPTHPELLRWLARDFVRGGYDLKKLARQILTSHAYQRATDRTLREPGPLYAAPAPRRLAAEQIVDSLFAATGKPFRLEEVSLDIDGRRDQNASISLGKPRRSWMLTSTSNERDRPSLALPRIQMVADVLTAFGWRGARQDPASARDQSPNVLQPAILSNGPVGTWLTRLSDDHPITALALESRSADELVETLFLRMLTRKPTDDERRMYREYLSDGFATRIRPVPPTAKPKRIREPYVSWSNHLDGEATLVRQAQELAARRGDPPTERLNENWRSRLEDVLWAMVNSSEFVFAP
jgi:mono/diheme cytochrome c family protein